MVIGTNKNIIEIVLRYTTQGVEKANATARKHNQMINTQRQKYEDTNKTGKRMIDTTRNNTIANSKFSEVMTMNRERLGKFNNEGRKMVNFGGRMANRFRMMTHGARGFRMEMLGVMFFGMMLYRVFGGLIKTSLQWMGVTEILALAMGILFLPVAEQMLNWALKFLQYVLELTPAQKKFIGTVVLLGAALGGALFIIGSFALGIGSVIMAFGFLVSPLGLVLAGLTALLALAGFGIFWKDFSRGVDGAKEKLVDFGVSGELIDTLFEGMKNASGKIKNVLVNMWEKGKEWFSENWGEMFLKGQEFLQKILTGIRDNAPKIKGVLSKLIDNTAAFIDENFSSFIEFGLDILKTIIDGIEKNLDIIGSALEELLTIIGMWVGQNADKFIIIGLDIAGHIIKGFTAGLINMPVKFLDKMFGTNTKQFKLPETPHIEPVKDFILQPGGKLIKTDPNDTIMGSKSGFGGGQNIIVTYNITGVSSPQDVKNMLEENNRQLTEEVRRGVGG